MGLNVIDADIDELVALWRDIHANPETAFDETRTSELVAAKLRAWGIETHTSIGKTGVVGVIRGTGAAPGMGRTIALRADMDALPMEEEGRPLHRSLRQGVFHGCGHDGHTAMLLGTARHFSRHRDFAGTLVLIFQPAEETGGGALAMLADGLESRFPYDEIYGMHNAPHFAPGTFGVRDGAMLASCDEMRIDVTGVGGHGSSPEKTRDPIAAAAQLICALQTVVSRAIDPASAAVLSIGSIHAGTTSNVIPSHAQMTGTVRTFDESVRERMKARIESICAGVALATECEIAVTFYGSSPATINHRVQAEAAAAAAEQVFGAENVLRDFPPLNGSEDFSEFLLRRPGAYVLLGQGGVYCHHPEFDFNDDVLPLGVRFFVTLALARLDA
ncbi:M20 family metallopeptidase [Paraburkholderia fungorum]|uniref:M20 family metallopeptidase n=1 Tax=Paraburkholderia fungorum TaxID=134537 RepID=A0AAP5UWE7_9BURK|nr:M20 aminoacylase family protein [Paraburkholderia fungorum]MDT8838889.1 M20 family metallopeptidase [Paraburkholderia fungorum]PRZ55099.1 hippurate hydrolase [Paraburkholderia fungorum]